MARNINAEVLRMLPEEDIEYFFVASAVGRPAPETPLAAALEEFRMAATNIPVQATRLEAARTALHAALDAAGAIGEVSEVWAARKKAAADAAKAKAAVAGNPAGIWNKPIYTNKTMQEVQPKLFVGSHHPASDAALLKQHGVTHVLCCVDVAPRFPTQFRYLTLPAQDANSYDISQHFTATYDFIAGALGGGGGVLVHCGAGISRAPTVTAAYLIRRLGVTAHVAIAMIRKVRESASPNAGFFSQLQAYEKSCRATDLKCPTP